MKLRFKIILINLLISFLSVFLVTWLAYYEVRKTLIAENFSKLETITDLKLKNIQEYFDRFRKDVEIAQNYFNLKTNLPIVAQYYTEPENAEYLKAKNMLDNQLKAWEKRTDVRDVMLISPDGKIVYSSDTNHAKEELGLSPNDPGALSFVRGKEEIFISDLYSDPEKENTYSIMVSAPIYGFAGNFEGVFVLHLEAQSIYAMIQDTEGLGRTGETIIARKEGNKVLYLNPLRFDPSAAFKRTADIDKQSALPAVMAVIGANDQGESMDYRGEKVLAVWRYLPIQGWGLVAKIDQREVLQPLNQIILFSLIALMILLMFVIGLSFLSVYFILRPISMLARVAHSIADGQSEERVEIKSQDEIGEFAESFNKMMDSLEKSRANIEKKVFERTAELEKTNEFMVGRELRMIELKKELENLKVKK